VKKPDRKLALAAAALVAAATAAAIAPPLAHSSHGSRGLDITHNGERIMPKVPDKRFAFRGGF
jgi:hypothetical protein